MFPINRAGVSDFIKRVRAALSGFIQRIRAALERFVGLFTRHPVLWLFLVTFVVAAIGNPIKIGTFLFGVSKLAAFAWLGHWIDRRFFYEAQPEDLSGIEQGTAWKRKGMIISAAIVAGALV